MNISWRLFFGVAAALCGYLTFLCAGVQAAVGAEASLLRVLFVAAGEGSEEVVLLLDGEPEMNLFRLDGESPRLVIDLFSTSFAGDARQIDVDGELVRGIRIGIHADPPKTRVVVDLGAELTWEYSYRFSQETEQLRVVVGTDVAAVESTDKPFTAKPAEEPVEAEQETGTTVAVGTSPEPVLVPAPQPPVAAVEDPATAEDEALLSQEPVPVSEASISLEQQTPPPDQQELNAQPVTPFNPPSWLEIPDGAPLPLPPEEHDQPNTQQDREEQPSVPPADQLIPEPDAENPTQGKADQGATEQESEQFADTAPVDEIPVPMLREITFELTENNSEMVFFRLNDFFPPEVFALEEDDPRVVFDFADMSLGENVPENLGTGGKFVHRIRVARHTDPNKIRVVLHLVPNRNYDLQQLFFKEENLFVVIVTELVGQATS
jgi:hypothetical protein